MPREIPGVRLHVLASANLFLGASNFVIVALPERYVVGGTINPSEVAGTEQARGAKWVLDGRCSHYLRDPAAQRSLELLIVGDRGQRQPKWSAEEGVAPARFAEHEGRLRVDTIRAGFPRRRTMGRLRASWPCERTHRTLHVEVLAPEGVDLGPIGESLTLSECH
jgi:hypothetical protein